VGLLSTAPMKSTGRGEGSASPFADQARPVGELIRLMDTGVHMVSITHQNVAN
jgi:hypothetical protein